MREVWYAAGIVIAWVLGVLSATAQVANAPPVPEWIEHPGAVSNQPVVFRISFEARPPLLKAILLAAGEGRMSVYLNGHALGEIVSRDRALGLDATPHILAGFNTILVRAINSNGPARISLSLELNGDLARNQWIVSDSTWLTVTNSAPVARKGEDKWASVRSLGRVDAQPKANPFDEKRAFDAYNSWKLALGTNSATDPATFALASGFKAELVRSAQPGEGSWVSMAFDPKGRLTLARENRGLIRLTLAPEGVQRVEVINDTLLECRGLLYAYDALYVNANNSKGFYRLRDTDGDDQFDEEKLLLRTGGSVGHGRNHVVLGPDGAIWLVHGNNVMLTEKIATSSPLQRYRQDSVIPCPFDDSMFDGDVHLPAGHILRTDRDGTRFELFAGGFRNPLDIAFNADGEMFTFDADMEWDVGSPWYRPNRVNHVISGADFGWRRGTSKFPDYFPETLPSTLDIGLASPTGIEFGTKSDFPEPYSSALYIADWAYGRVLAVHPRARGASYTATSELFMSGRPLNVTDLTFGPDGAMYLITGGRTTQSGLYRISYAGARPKVSPKSAAEVAAQAEAAEARRVRRELEGLHHSQKSPQQVIDAVWPHLGSADAHIRHAARVALELQDVRVWQERALGETQPDIALTAWLALARTGSSDVQHPVLERLNTLAISSLNQPEQLRAFRTYEVVCSRLGKPAPSQLKAMLEKLEPLYPARDWQLNHRLCTLLVYLDSAQVISKTLDLLAKTERPEDLMQYLFYLRYVKSGWTPPQREAWFRALARAEQTQGARDYYAVLKRIRDEMIAATPSDQIDRITSLMTKRNDSSGLPPAGELKFVKQWQLGDFDLGQPWRGTRERGRAAFHAAQCILCHVFGNEGGLIGPDLTSVASRFDRRTLMESILEPSKVIDEKFRNTVFILDDGTSVVGTPEREDEQKVLVRESAFVDKPTVVPKDKLLRRELSPVSPMPTGLVDVLQREQILELIAYLESGAGLQPKSSK